MIGDSTDETNFPYKLLLTKNQVLKILKAFSNGSSTNIKFSKTQLYKMVQLGWLMEPMLGSNSFLLFFLILKNKHKIIFGLDERLSVAYKTKKVLEEPTFDEVLGITISGIKLTNSEIKDIAKVIN